MTAREKLAIEHPECIDNKFTAGCKGCPSEYGYLPEFQHGCGGMATCKDCWNREIPEEKEPDKIRGLRRKANFMEDATSDIPEEVLQEMVKPFAHDDTIEEKFVIATPRILDSGDRTEFESGAVRDMRVGKGRCDLLPLDVVAEWIRHCNVPDEVLTNIYRFQESGGYTHLYVALDEFDIRHWHDNKTLLLETAIHFEEGALKYGDDNWRRGIPVNVYIDSGVRHYLKFLRGDTDEPHDRAFAWNLLCAIWTAKHMPELNPYGKSE